MLTGQLHEALDDLKNILTVDNQQIDTHCNLAAIYLKLNNKTAALAHYQIILTLKADHSIASYMISALTQQSTPDSAPVEYIKNLFPNKIVKAFDLVKSKIEARDNALHLDCCFQPVGKNKGIIYKSGFREEADYMFLVNLFGKVNLFHITRDEMYDMNSNVFSIDENVVVSEQKFTRLNTWLRENGFIVEEIPYAEIAKQEGLLRCSTLPLIRD
jgi:arginine deiminase